MKILNTLVIIEIEELSSFKYLTIIVLYNLAHQNSKEYHQVIT